ncbi:hypothetical protein BJF83_20700 [Nocardiopsis sp. CNR-923]|uniref:hypothetical protein n=1 Tax=Nocardiopsis sp. CNR-923 TaxID=1904965 RepID=UPI000962F1A0|nr:hypothetical protein [Nocardiopsis sp. CNR-923]OLT26585.1 hypothetical protein BJF83_20700 [Nocardiopsis sp. CNR-923]
MGDSTTVSVKGNNFDRQEQPMFSFSFGGRSLTWRPFFFVLILIVVCWLAVSGHGLLGALGLVAVTVIVAADLSTRLSQARAVL